MTIDPQVIGEKIASRCFELRGNRSEAHLSRRELAMWCQAAVQVAINTQSQQAVAARG